MKKLIFLIVIALAFFAFQSEPILAKGKEQNLTVTYALSPAPSCQNCVNKIKNNLRFEKGVKAIDVDLKEKNVKITYSPSATSPERLAEALKKIGYTATPYDAAGANPRQECQGDTCAVAL